MLLWWKTKPASVAIGIRLAFDMGISSQTVNIPSLVHSCNEYNSESRNTRGSLGSALGLGITPLKGLLDDSNIVMYILVSRTVIAFAKLLIVCKQSKVYHCRLGAIYVEGISGDVLR